MADKKETAIVQRKETDALVPDSQNMTQLSEMLLKSGMWPNLKDKGVAGVFAIIEYGRELGIPPVAALNTMAIVNGRLTMEAKALLAVAHDRAGVTWKVETLTPKGCIMIFSRPGFEPVKTSFDETDAKAAELLGKDNWQNYPKDMYFARTASRGIRQIAPDAVLGLYAIEEMQDIVMPEAGEVIEAQVVNEKKEEKTPEPEKAKKGKTKPDLKPEEKPKENGKAIPPPTTELEKTRLEILRVMETLSTEFNHVPEELVGKIKARVLRVFGRAVEKIPDDLSEKEATVILHSIQKTLEAEKGAAEKEREKEGIL